MAFRIIQRVNVGDRIWLYGRDEKNRLRTKWEDSDIIDGPYANLDAVIASTTGEVRSGLLKALGASEGLTDE